MATQDYKRVLEKTKADLISHQHKVGRLIKEQEVTEKEMSNLREIIAALSKLLGETFVEEDALGLTDAIRQAFKTTKGPLEPTEVRSKLVELGYDISKYGNFMASIHTVINRLVKSKEVKSQIIHPGNKTAYIWTENIPVPSQAAANPFKK